MNAIPKKNIVYLVLIFTVLIVIGVFVVKPGIVGYAVYQDIQKLNYSMGNYGDDMEELNSELLVSETDLDSCNKFNKELLGELDKYADKISECSNDLGASEVRLDSTKDKYGKEISELKNEHKEEIENLEEKYEEEISELKDEVSDGGDEASDYKERYDTLAENLANNLCCKRKIDNPSIRYYVVENDRIICSEEGALKISCS